MASLFLLSVAGKYSLEGTQCPLSEWSPTSAIVEGFGCRPQRMLTGPAAGRRPEAFRGGSRGQLAERW